MRLATIAVVLGLLSAATGSWFGFSTKEGCGIDPSGLLTPPADAGCVLDPNGGCATANLESGSELDPNGHAGWNLSQH
jgi:hypothetical protein